MALAILEYTKDKRGFDDVVNVCNSVIGASNNKDESTEDNRDNEKHGWVYMFKLGRYYKVGRSKDTGRRYRELSVQFPDELEHRHKIETDDPSGLEAYWHNRFMLKHKKGDFFNLDLSDVKAFKRWKRIF